MAKNNPGITTRVTVKAIPNCDCGQCPRISCNKCQTREATEEITLIELGVTLYGCLDCTVMLIPEYLDNNRKVNSTIRGQA